MNENGLIMSWSVDQDNRVLDVVLKNTSTNEVGVRAASHFEADIIVTSSGGWRLEYHERRFYDLLLTSIWFVPSRTLSPGEELAWSIAFEDIIPGPYNDTLFAMAIESGEVTIEDFWGFREALAAD